MIWEAKAASHIRRVFNVNYLLCPHWCAPSHGAQTEATQSPWHGVLQRWPWLSSLCISCRYCCPSAAPREVCDLCTSAPKPCSGCLELPFSPAFVCAAFPTTPSSAGTQKGFLAVAQGWGVGALLGECPLWSAVSWAWREGRNLGTTFPSHFVTLMSIRRNLSNFG